MIKHIKKHVGIFLLCFGLCFSMATVAIIGITSHSVSAESGTLEFTGEGLLSDYVIGDIVDIPSANIVYDGVTYVADETVAVYCPDGSVLSSRRVVLNQTGNYRAVYGTTVNKTRVTAEKTFSVRKSVYQIPSSGACYYSETAKTQNPAHFQGGLNIDLAQGSEFVYDRAVDISDTALDTPVITFAPYQYSHYMLDSNGRAVYQANKFYLRITDAYDSGNYIELYMLNRSNDIATQESGKRTYPYLTVGAAGQTRFALDSTSRYDPKYNNGKIVKVDGVEYCAVYEKFGVNHGLVPYGQATDESGVGNDLQGGWFSVYYDSKSAGIYVTAPTRNGNSPAVIKRLFLNDLDNESIYPSDGFKGFTTGEVFISLKADDYQSDKVQFEILDICGIKGKELSETTVDDTRSPILVFDKVSDGQNFLVKKNSAVKLPTATAYDVNIKGNVITRVYYDYGTERQCLINSDGGEFIPQKTGMYTAEYTAVDTFGNPTTKTLIFSCIDGDVIDFSVEKLSDGIKAGEYADLPDYSIESKNGKSFVDVTVKFGDKKIPLEENDSKFFVDYVGEYLIVYEYGDALTTTTYSYKVNSVKSDNVVFGNVNFPEYFIKNAKYTLDPVYVYTYQSAQPASAIADVFVKEDAASDFRKINYGDYNVKASEQVQFKFVYNDNVHLSEVFPVVDASFDGKIEMQKYLAGDVTATAEKRYIQVLSNKISGDTTVKFINPVAFSEFRFDFSVPDEYSSFEGLEVKLIDYYDRKNSSVIGFYNNAGKMQIRIGNSTVDLVHAFVGTDFSVWYDQVTGKFAESFGSSVDFTGAFSSDRVLVEFTIKNASGLGGFRLKQINNQPLTSNNRDYYPATFTCENLYGGINEINSTVTVFNGNATDVLCPYYADNFYVTVKTPSGGFATATDSTVLNEASATKSYNMVLSEYGRYIISYEYLDQKNNSTTYTYYMDVVDTQSPVITIENGYNEKTRVLIKEGATVKIANYNVSDNNTPADKLVTYVYVWHANGNMAEIKDGAFVAKDKGDYIVYYYCYDDSLNYTIAKYYVRVQ